MFFDDTVVQPPTVSVKKREKKNKKDSQLVIRISRKTRDEFVDICDELDTSAAREIRRFINDFLKQHER